VCNRSQRFHSILLFVSAAIVFLGPIGSPSRAFAQTAHQQEDPSSDAGSPATTFRVFGGAEWSARKLPDVPNSFSLGQLDLFVTSNLSERVSVLAEVVVEGQRGLGTRFVTDIERLQLTFRLNDFFNVSAGRYHTGIGFYNAAFHHGAYFETPIGRPRVFMFEDTGGALPIHDVGVTARGVVPKTGSSLRYVAEVGNGRPWTVPANEGPGGGSDANDAKSTNVGVSYRPDGWRGFEVGTSYYRDTIAQTVTSTVDHHVAGIYAVYRTPSTEVMAEWLLLGHVTEDRSEYDNDGGYVQASRAWGMLRPYYRFDRLTINPATPFIGPIGSYKAQIAGLRVDPVRWVGLKAQYERTDESGRRGVDGVRAQLVFVF
jgi:hypothetical protein